jgi:hypothetical protein
MNNKSVLTILLTALLAASGGWTAASQDAEQGSLPEEMIVPEGTVIPIVLTAYLNTRNSQVGDIVYSDTNYPIWIQQRLVIPKGSIVRGTVTDVVRPGRIRGKGRLAIRFDDILLPNGVKRDIVAIFRGIHGSGDENLDRRSETVSAGSSTGDDMENVVGMSGQGAIIGVIAGQGSGAAIGAGIGAAAGIATTLFTRGRDLVISPGTQFDLELKKPLRFAFNELEFSKAQLDNARREIPRDQNAAPPRRSVLGMPYPIGMPFPRF